MFTPSTPPIVVLGAHRSGTSAVTEGLQDLGLFVGARLDSHAESTFFQRLNRQLTHEAGGHWTNPAAVCRELAEPRALVQFAEPLRTYVHGPAAVEYWGLHRRSKRLRRPWGWKDPRATYLVPLWSAVYPDLRIVSVQRDPRATARSLHLRTTGLRAAIEQSPTAGLPAVSLRTGLRSLRGRPMLADGWRTMSYEGALDVALSYRELQTALADTSAAVHVIDYERLVHEPGPVLGACAAFCGLDTSPAAIAAASAAIVARPEHAGDLAVLDTVTEEQRRRLAALGYH